MIHSLKMRIAPDGFSNAKGEQAGSYQRKQASHRKCQTVAAMFSVAA